MSETKRLSVRACPICRVSMVHCDFGWSCPQCGTAIIDPRKSDGEVRKPVPEEPTRAAGGGALRG